MDFFRIEFSEVAEKLDIGALAEAERISLFQGVTPDPTTHDVFRILLAVTPKDAPPSWSDRQKKRKRFSIVDRMFVDIRPKASEIRIMGIFPTSISAEGQQNFDLEGQAGLKILEVGTASLKFSGPIKNWWRKQRPLVVSSRTDRLAQWVYSRQWIDDGNQCQGQFLCITPKDLTEEKRIISCFADFKDKNGRAVEKARKLVQLPR